MTTTFSSTPEKGTIGFDARIDRPDRSKLSTCRTGKHATRRAAVLACLERIAREGLRVKATDTITTHEWTADGLGSWQVEMMRILSGAEKITVATARDWQAAESVTTQRLENIAAQLALRLDGDGDGSDMACHDWQG